MLDIKKLERRWLKYKLKLYAPYIIITFLLTSFAIAFFIWSKMDKNTQQPIAKDSISKAPSKPTTKIVHTSSSDENTTILEPSMDFVQSFQYAPISEDAPAAPATVKNKPLRTTTSIAPAPKILSMPEYSPPAVTPPPVIKPKNQESLSINRNNESKLDINELQRRFKETSNANLGLFIARYYYDHGNYDEAYNYALKTNNVNNRIDESWIIFSKSLVKLGRTDQAKKTLQLYIQQSNSESARGLLDSIERGTFK